MLDHWRFVVDLHLQTKHALHTWGGGICITEDDENMHNCPWHFSFPRPAAQNFGSGRAWKRLARGRLPGRAAERSLQDIKLLFLLEQHKSGLIISPRRPCARRGHARHDWGGWNNDSSTCHSCVHIVWQLQTHLKILFASFRCFLQIPNTTEGSITQFHPTVPNLSIPVSVFHHIAAFIGRGWCLQAYQVKQIF